MTIEKTSIIGDVLDADPTTASFFFDMGMHASDAVRKRRVH